MNETWRTVWRQGIAPQFSDTALLSLLAALRDDDGRLLQEATVRPLPPTPAEWPCEAACPLAWLGWMGGPQMVCEVEQAFADACCYCDQTMHEPGVIRYFLQWVDSTPRDTMRRELALEVATVLVEREREKAEDPT